MGTNKYKTNDFTPSNLSEAEAQRRLDLYSEQGDADQFFSIQKIKKRYLSKNREKSDKRAISDAYLAQGYRGGFPHASPENIKYAREIEDQSDRDQVVREGRSEYRKGENLSKWFNNGEYEDMGKDKVEIADKVHARKQIGKLIAEYNRVRYVHPREDLKDEFKIVKGRDWGR
ncbi:MAG: hypothetical protein RIF46_07715 [Cyclobacteriaceae bacterium]